MISCMSCLGNLLPQKSLALGLAGVWGGNGKNKSVCREMSMFVQGTDPAETFLFHHFFFFH